MINFHTEDIKFNLKNKTVLKQWIAIVIKKSKHSTGEITFVFCSDDYLLKMNKQYLKHDTYTDIITFDYSNQFPHVREPVLSLSKEAREISGDIFISIDRVKENSQKFSKSFEEELHRIIIHGVLHLLGYKDKTKSAKGEMSKQEDLCLKSLKKILPPRHYVTKSH